MKLKTKDQIEALETADFERIHKIRSAAGRYGIPEELMNLLIVQGIPTDEAEAVAECYEMEGSVKVRGVRFENPEFDTLD